MRAVESDYFTEAETDTELRVLRLERAARRGEAEAPAAEDYAVATGEVHVTTLATQYKKVRFYTRESVGAEDIHLPADPETGEQVQPADAVRDAFPVRSAETLQMLEGWLVQI